VAQLYYLQYPTVVDRLVLAGSGGVTLSRPHRTEARTPTSPP